MTPHDCTNQKDIDELKHKVFGNGRPGIAYTTERLEQRMIHIEGSMKTVISLQFGVILSIIGAAIAIITR
jgi:hypothetical protein